MSSIFALVSTTINGLSCAWRAAGAYWGAVVLSQRHKSG